jgi:hypothetical protein
VFRARRHPLAGLVLLAILTPLLAAGPGMPCAGDDIAHHEAVGHVMDHDQAPMQSAMHIAGVSQSPDADQDSPEPMACSMGMMCSGTVVTPLAATLAAAPVVQTPQVSATLWAPHLSDLSLPDRPPNA